MEEQEEKKYAYIEKLDTIRAVRKLSSPDSKWSITQEILQEIHSAYIVADPNKRPSLNKMSEELKKEIEIRYDEDPELKKLLIDSIPSIASIGKWLKKEGWEDAVWKKIRSDNLFSPEKRAQVIESLRARALDKSDSAAKIWLTLSGDYSEKMEVNDKSLDSYREINSILHKKKQKEE